MLYLPSLADQTKLFLYCLGFGFALGLLYDVFRILRLAFFGGQRWQLFAQDIVYAVVCTVLSFYFFLIAGDGALRFYTVGGEILGWLLYYVSFGTVAIRVSSWCVRGVQRVSAAVLRTLCAPFVWMGQKTTAGAKKIGNRGKTALRRAEKKLRFRLTCGGQMMYNGEASMPHRKKKRGQGETSADEKKSPKVPEKNRAHTRPRS
jgi:spore cortex biosynthesis protein YabQ